MLYYAPYCKLFSITRIFIILMDSNEQIIYILRGNTWQHRPLSVEWYSGGYLQIILYIIT